MRTGILGGTFDPVHKGHIAIAEAAVQEYGLDRVVFMPAGAPYFKDGTSVSPALVRLSMTRACVEALPGGYRFEVSDMEINDKNRTYTSDTLLKFRKLYPHDRLFFILGLDSLKAIKSWHAPEIILGNAVILCASRDAADDFKTARRCAKEMMRDYKDVNADIRVIHTPETDISSTGIRKVYKNGGDISDFVTPEVLDFIKSNALYLN